MLTALLLMIASAAAAGGFVAYRLKGDKTLTEALRAVILGPGPFRPK